jgi:hypothetical protein
MYNMNKIILSVLVLMVGFQPVRAEKIKFSSDQEAVDYINTACVKYWQKATLAEQTGVKVAVHQDNKHLIIDEKSTFARPAQYGREAYTETKDVTITIDLSKVKLSRTFTNIILSETQSNAITVATVWSTKSIDNKTEHPVVYTLPLVYDKRETELEIPRLSTAFRYLVTRYNPSEKKKSFSALRK